MAETTLRAEPFTRSVEQARRHAADALRSWALPGAEEAVVAIVAELVANAVRHARTPLELRLVHADGRVRVEVRDRDDRGPVLRAPGPLDDGGRGIFLVDAYAVDWGVDPCPGGGKIVWAEVEVTAPGTSPRP